MTGTKFYGKYRGEVTDNLDPKCIGRLRVSVPDVFGGQSTEWALPCTPYAGTKLGFFALPDIGTNVWIEFEAGDPSLPIWTGCFWNPGDIDTEDANPDVKFFRTQKATIRIDDSSGEILLGNDSGTSIEITPGGIVTKGA